jgi:hypothetical protein
MENLDRWWLAVAFDENEDEDEDDPDGEPFGADEN